MVLKTNFLSQHLGTQDNTKDMKDQTIDPEEAERT